MTSETKIVNGVTLYRIKALISFGDIHEGDIGGFIEKEENLSNEGNAWVYGDAEVCGNAWVFGDAEVYGNAWIFGDAKVCGDAKVFGDAEVYGSTMVYGNVWLGDDAMIRDDADYLHFMGLGSCNRNTTFFKCHDGHIHVFCGCFHGNLAEFENQVRETHGDTKYAKEYLACVTTVKIHFGIE